FNRLDSFWTVSTRIPADPPGRRRGTFAPKGIRTRASIADAALSLTREKNQKNRGRLPATPAIESNGVPTGIRTPVSTVKGWCPRPLDDGDAVELESNP